MIKRIGLTGGIGSGKSQAADFLKEAQIPVLAMDSIGHELLAGDEEVKAGVTACFGEEVLEEGQLSREKIGARVFHDPEALKALNDLLHPAIARETLRRCQALEDQGEPVVVIEAALFAEDLKREDWLHGLILVNAPREQRIKRLQESRKMEREEIEKRMARQCDPERKKALADWIIENDSTLESLRLQVQQLADKLRAFAAGNA
jgi:dephospho-CoA kinase